MKVNRTLFKSLAVAAFLLAATGLACAQETLRSPALKQFEAAGGSVDFIGSAHGLDGWVVKDDKGVVKTTVYTTQDGAMVAAGMLFSADGATNETTQQLQAYHQRISGAQTAAPGADASSSKSEKLYAQAEKAGWVALGNSSAPYIYMFMNVSCDHCQDFWKELYGAVEGGKLQVRLVPYGKTDINRDGGAALLSSDNPLKSWTDYVSGDKTALGKDKAKDDGYHKIDANTALVADWKLPGPPFTLYRRPADGVLTAVVGRPENAMLLLAEFIK
jgi:protein-disulfide isomerase